LKIALAAIAGTAHGSSTAIEKNTLPRRRWFKSSATAKPKAIVPATHTVPKTTVFTSEARRCSSEKTSLKLSRPTHVDPP
jgi:hypothetical protein